jgi:hypothetical protein
MRTRWLLGVVVTLAAMVGACGYGVHLAAGPSLAGAKLGASAALEAEVHLGGQERSSVLRYRAGGSYHHGGGAAFLFGFAVGPAWADGRWAGGVGVSFNMAGENDVGLTFSGEIHHAPLRGQIGGVERCQGRARGSSEGYTVRVRQLRIGALAGAGPDATFAWIPIALGSVWWRLQCPYIDEM